MSFVKRQQARKRSKISPNTLDKSGGGSRTEIERANYVLRYGKDWVKHWWEDHPGACGQFDPDPVVVNKVVRVPCPADQAYARGQAAYVDGIVINPYEPTGMRAGWWADGYNDAQAGIIGLRPMLSEREG